MIILDVFWVTNMMNGGLQTEHLDILGVDSSNGRCRLVPSYLQPQGVVS